MDFYALSSRDQTVIEDKIGHIVRESIAKWLSKNFTYESNGKSTSGRTVHINLRILPEMLRLCLEDRLYFEMNNKLGKSFEQYIYNAVPPGCIAQTIICDGLIVYAEYPHVHLQFNVRSVKSTPLLEPIIHKYVTKKPKEPKTDNYLYDERPVPGKGKNRLPL
jgi:hypothetical protein